MASWPRVPFVAAPVSVPFVVSGSSPDLAEFRLWQRRGRAASGDGTGDDVDGASNIDSGGGCREIVVEDGGGDSGSRVATNAYSVTDINDDDNEADDEEGDNEGESGNGAGSLASPVTRILTMAGSIPGIPDLAPGALPCLTIDSLPGVASSSLSNFSAPDMIEHFMSAPSALHASSPRDLPPDRRNLPQGWSSQGENDHESAIGGGEEREAPDGGYDSEPPELHSSSPNSSPASSLPGLLSDSSDSDNAPPGLASSSSDDTQGLPGSVSAGGRSRASRRVRRAGSISRQGVGASLPRRVPAYYRSAFIAPPIMDNAIHPIDSLRGAYDFPPDGDEEEGDETEGDDADADLGTLTARRFQRDIASLIMPRRLMHSRSTVGHPTRQFDLGLRRMTYVIMFVSVTYY